MKKEDRKIGHLIKELRRARGMSQMKLAEMVGVSYQQIQKYEKGASKISIERLEQISKALDAPINLFFQSEKWEVSETQTIYGKITDNEHLLLQLFRKIKNEKLKNAILEFLKTVVK
jgi:transcriptional regulator with XRE-family HTH domain